MFESLQRALTYFPARGPVSSARRFAPNARDVVLNTDDGLSLAAWWFPPGASASGVPAPDRGAADRDIAGRDSAVLFAPGNGGNREGRVPLFLALARRGFPVLALDYRGYGENPGVPSEDGLAADARAAAAWLRAEGFGPDRTLYLGESLGTAVAARLATSYPPAGLLLRSPFPSLREVGRRLYPWLPVDRLLVDDFATLTYLAGCRAPVSVLRGSADDIVATDLSARVAASVSRLVEDLEVPGADHNDPVWYGDVVAGALVRLADATAVQ